MVAQSLGSGLGGIRRTVGICFRSDAADIVARQDRAVRSILPLTPFHKLGRELKNLQALEPSPQP
jgi:hypothetical protein